jgi:hypothetical protein
VRIIAAAAGSMSEVYGSTTASDKRREHEGETINPLLLSVGMRFVKGLMSFKEKIVPVCQV